MSASAALLSEIAKVNIGNLLVRCWCSNGNLKCRSTESRGGLKVAAALGGLRGLIGWFYTLFWPKWIEQLTDVGRRDRF